MAAGATRGSFPLSRPQDLNGQLPPHPPPAVRGQTPSCQPPPRGKDLGRKTTNRPTTTTKTQKKKKHVAPKPGNAAASHTAGLRRTAGGGAPWWPRCGSGRAALRPLSGREAAEAVRALRRRRSPRFSRRRFRVLRRRRRQRGRSDGRAAAGSLQPTRRVSLAAAPAVACRPSPGFMRLQGAAGQRRGWEMAFVLRAKPDGLHSSVRTVSLVSGPLGSSHPLFPSVGWA